MKRIILDNCFVNRLIDENYQPTNALNYLVDKKEKGEIEIFAIPTNIIEIALCSDHKKRQALANTLNNLINGENIELSWAAHLVRILFGEIDNQIPGFFINKNSLLYEARNHAKLLLGLLGQLCCFIDYPFTAYDSIVKQKLITKYYQARFVSDPEYYLKLYILQLTTSITDKNVEDDSLLDGLSNQELKSKITQLENNRKKISNIKDFSKYKSKFIEFFSKYELKNLFINFFHYRETIETSTNIKILVKNWNKELFGATAKPLPQELVDLAYNDDSVLSKEYYNYVFIKLADRLPEGFYFPLDHMYNIYLNEIELMINKSKDLSKGSALDLDYYPACLMSDYFLTDDKVLYENIRRMLKKINRDENMVQSFQSDWMKYV
ncbi:hypothetical protein [Treponema denticola]|uniref:hypothetical protein n=1 Tax=Treponema denticola TaxID=158 RepID=UPI002107C728|nr:hypothetical protein [Treponema denticola]UTY26145.1 hypothetical protein E4N77_05270 [Treponema denticola]